jgi:hypothetical protein
MVFPVTGGTQSTGYEISNSLRFNDDDSASLSRAFSTDPSDQKLTTISFWFKIGNITSAFRALYRFNDGSSTGAIYLRNGNDLQFAWDLSSGSLDVRPNGVFRDPAAWNHCHIKVDTTQGTDSNRVIIHINGVERSYSTTTYPGQNTTLKHLSNGKTYYIGGSPPNSDYYFDGYVTEFHVIDGQAKDYTDFGEFDDNGVWIPKKYTGTYGNNGYYLQFKQTGTSANSSGIGADTSGNDLHWTPSNLAALDVTEDTCTNNFATFSPLGRTNSGTVTLSEGNCKIEGTSSTNASGQHGTIAFTSGKWYLEMKATDSTTTQLGFLTVNTSALGDNSSDGNGGMYYHYANIYYQYNNSGINVVNTGGGGIGAATVSGGSNSSLGGFSDGDILMFALDMDNNRAYFGKNGTWFNSGNPANGTNYFSLQTDVTDGVTFYAAVDANTGTELNTGNPPFSISSGNNDGKYGNFEYEVPSGYYAMCTKRLAEFG